MTRTRNQTADDLIPMTGVSPRQALAAARALLATRPGPREASIAHQAAAIVLRDFGDVGAAIREFRLAARLARAAAEPDREADVLTSLGTALVMAGRTEAGLAALDEALALAASGTARGRILVRRGGSLYIAGRYDEARADLRNAITLTRRSGEVLWEARARTAAALADLAVGATARAEAGFLAAESPRDRPAARDRLRAAEPGTGRVRLRRPRRRAARRPRRRLPRHRRRPGSDRGRLVLHRPGRVITPSQGRSMPGDGAPSAEVVSSTSPAS